MANNTKQDLTCNTNKSSSSRYEKRGHASQERPYLPAFNKTSNKTDNTLIRIHSIKICHTHSYSHHSQLRTAANHPWAGFSNGHQINFWKCFKQL